MSSKKYTLFDFLRDFSSTEQCLIFMRNRRYPDGIKCRKCKEITPHYLRPEQKAFACGRCGTLTTPTKGTIFFRSNVPLPNWFWVIFQMAKTRTGLAAKDIERELGISYRAALRMCHKIRETLGTDFEQLEGQVEADEVYLGNSRRYFGRKRKRGRGVGKRPVFGMVERGGAVVAKVVPDCKRDTVFPIIKEHVKEGSEVFTDEYRVYNTLSEEGYRHDSVCHSAGEYVKYRRDGEKVHTNEMEGFWSYPKNAIKGVHRGVSDKHLQGYVNVYTFRQSHRKDERPMFFAMLEKIIPVERYAA